jgi:ferric-dicitrate binding protein FerR (iron transport regulator)/TolA-binding protein
VKATHENGREHRRHMFGVLVAAQDEQRKASGAVVKARGRYQRTLEQGVRPRAATSFAWLALPSLAVASFLVWLVLRPPVMTFAVGGTAEGRIGAALTASESPLPLRFSDGSEVELRADPHTGATMRVVNLWRDGARVTLESGRAKVHVMHRQNTRWVFSAGPYDVRVIGTRFVLAWNPDAQSFALTLAEGRVEVSGGSLPAPLVVVEGQVLHLDPGAVSLRLAHESVEGPSDSADLPPQSARPLSDNAGPAPLAEEPNSSASVPETMRGGANPDPEVRPSDRRRAPKDERSTWLELATAGKYGEALAAAEEEGFAKICDRAALTELVTLAQAARFARNTARSRQALQAARARFAADPQAEVATFLLGRLALEGRDYVAAERHFRAYLTKNPRGPLAAEVHGRLLETLEDGGHHESARIEATRYLEQFPHGSYATMAKKIVAR